MSDAFEGSFDEYLAPAIGRCITSVRDDDESVWLTLSDGSAIEIYGLEDGGFGVELHAECKTH